MRHAEHHRGDGKREDGLLDRDLIMENDVGIREAHDRFGGIDLPAIVGGTLAGLGCLLVLAVVGAALGVAGTDMTDIDTGELTTGAVIAGVVVLVVSAWAGGWVAGRLARYDGGRNGALGALTMMLIVVLSVGAGGSAVTDIEGLLGADVVREYGATDVGVAATAALVLIVAACMLAGFLGGRLGEDYHRRADAIVAQPSLGDPTRRISGRGEAALTSTRERVPDARVR